MNKHNWGIKKIMLLGLRLIFWFIIIFNTIFYLDESSNDGFVWGVVLFIISVILGIHHIIEEAK